MILDKARQLTAHIIPATMWLTVIPRVGQTCSGPQLENQDRLSFHLHLSSLSLSPHSQYDSC